MSLNKVMLIGRLGRDPEVRYTASGQAIASFSIATEERWKAQNGEMQKHTEWHNITLFGKLAEVAEQWLNKGSLVFVGGKIRSEKYTGKDGIERTAYKILGDELKMLGSKDDNGGNASQSHNAPPPPRKENRQAASDPNDINSDIPF